MWGRSAATEHAASSRPAMVMLVRAVVVMAGRYRPLMQDDGNRYSLGTLRDAGNLGVGPGLGLGLRRGSRNAG